MQSLTREFDTICALSTPPGHGALAVLRVSGPDAGAVSRKLLKFLPSEPQSHRVYYGIATRFESEQPIDEVLATYFAVNKSFTGEETVEISTHGSPAIVSAILRELTAAGARLAEKGEFTFRAFKNGRIDLIQAESVLALIESRNDAAARAALRQLRGQLSKGLAEIEESLIWTISRLEANIDFSQEDIEFEALDNIVTRSEASLAALRNLLASYRTGSVLRQGFRVALVGPTNAGKSSLFNRLVGFERSIVSPVDGTTRDFIEAEISVAGTPVTLIDTAGLRETADFIESEGIQRTRSILSDSDAIIHVVESTEEWAAETFKNFNRPIIKVLNKVDLGRPAGTAEHQFCAVSAVTGEGMETLFAKIAELIPQQTENESPVLLQARHYELLRKAEFHLSVATSYLVESASPDIVVSELNEAWQNVAAVTGKEIDEQIIDRIFQDFCLGK